MILSENLNLLFIKVPKTGSSSFELALAPELERTALITPILQEEVNLQWKALFPDFEPLWEKNPLRLARSSYLAIKQLGLKTFLTRLSSDLREQCGPASLGTDFWRFYNHISAGDVKARIGREKFSKLIKVAIVRHPYSRIISAYRYRLQKVNSYKTNPPKFEDWFQREKVLFRPITYFTHIKKKNALSLAIRYEDLDTGIKEFGDLVGIDTQLFVKRFKETKIHLYAPPTTNDLIGKYFNSERIQREVYDEYKVDFAAFNYQQDV
ncbi:MAG: hypothetical protein EBX88_04160 [Actinobacteria bacterium]|nr:hypothetical protein [Actinomycetota bacterium]